MKRFVTGAIIALGLSSSASADMYSDTHPDCSKDKTYINNIMKNGFETLFSFKDVFQDLDYNVFYNSQKHLEIIVSIDKQNRKICLIGVGSGNTLAAQSPDEVRNFFDDMLRNR